MLSARSVQSAEDRVVDRTETGMTHVFYFPRAIIDASIRFGNVDARKARLDICKHYAIML
jgi:hypothetical protein